LGKRERIMAYLMEMRRYFVFVIYFSLASLSLSYLGLSFPSIFYSLSLSPTLFPKDRKERKKKEENRRMKR